MAALFPLFKQVNPRDKLPTNTREIGSAGARYRRLLGGEEYNKTLAGKEGLKIFDKMRRKDPSIRRALKVAKIPVLAALWSVKSADPEKERDNRIRDFVDWNLFKGMNLTWIQFLTEALTMLEFGYSFFEKLYNNEMTPFGYKTIVKELAPRSPFDVTQWIYTNKGRPDGVILQDFDSGKDVFIPYEEVLTFTHDREANNVEGISALRCVYLNEFFKSKFYNIDGIQKERHGVGIPIFKMGPQNTAKDKQIAGQMGENLRVNEQAHLVTPYGMEVEMLSPQGSPVNPIESIEYHDMCIDKSVLADFLAPRSAEAAEVQSDLFLKGTRYLADIIREEINHKLIPELVKFNWPSKDVKEFPQLTVRRLAEDKDNVDLSRSARNWAGMGALQADDKLEDYIRDTLVLPGADKKTTRLVPMPQSAGGAGMPRQGPPSMGQGAVSDGGAQ